MKKTNLTMNFNVDITAKLCLDETTNTVSVEGLALDPEIAKKLTKTFLEKVEPWTTEDKEIMFSECKRCNSENSN